MRAEVDQDRPATLIAGVASARVRETALQAWNTAVDQRPVAVVFPESADDMVGCSRRPRLGARPLLGRAWRRRQLRRGDRDRAGALPGAEIYAGCLFWPIERATEILNAWRRWVETVPVDCHSIGRMLQLPDVPFLPEHVRGRSFVLVEPAFIGTESDGAALVQPLRDLEPEMDTIATMPTSDLSLVHMDPDFPLPYAGDSVLLDDLTPDAIDAIVGTFVGSPLLHKKAFATLIRADVSLNESSSG